MDTAHQILEKLLLWSERLRVHHDQFRLVGLTEMLEQSKAEASQPILVGNDHPFDLSGQDRIHDLEKAFAIKIEASPNFYDPLIDGNLLFQGVAFQRGALFQQVGPMRKTGYSAIGDRPACPWQLKKVERRGQIGPMIGATPSKSSSGFEPAFPVPALPRFHADTHLLGKLCD